MKVILIVAFFLISIPIRSVVFNDKIPVEYANLKLINSTMLWRGDSKSIVISMQQRKHVTLKKIEELWKEMN